MRTREQITSITRARLMTMMSARASLGVMLVLTPLLLSRGAARADEFHYVSRSGKVFRISPYGPALGPLTARQAGTTSTPNEPAPLSRSRDSVPAFATLATSAPWRHTVREAAMRYQLSEALLLSVIEVESEFNHLAVSSSGALGLMQLLPSTALELGVLDPFDGRQNIFGGAAYLRQLAGQLGPDLATVLAGYNAGPGTVRRWGGVPAIDKTQRYIAKVLAAYDRWQNAGVP